MLKATDLKKHYGGVTAVDGMSFEVPEGKITALIGPNGAGKTTLFNLLSGTAQADSGSVHLNGEDVSSLSVDKRASKGISRTFQLSRPFRNLTLEDHLRLASDRGDYDVFKSIIKDDERVDVHEWLKRVGIDELPLSRKGGDISYGQGKLLGLAMALAHPHCILLLDEPVAGVNPVIRERLRNLLVDLRKKGETILIIEHDMDFVMPLADRVVVMDRGRHLASGSPEEIRNDPAVLQAYLGEQL